MDSVFEAARAPLVSMTPEFGRVGVWAPLGRWTDYGGAVGEVAAELEELGFGTIWIGNGPATFGLATVLLEATRRITIATGIVNIKDHPVERAAAWHAGASARHPGRAVLGLGGGWGRVAGGRPGESWRERMVGYLDALDGWSPPVPRGSRVLAANGPLMLALARERCAGAHPFLVTPEHTSRARELLGDGPVLAPEQKVLLETDPLRARSIARRGLAFYLDKPNYLSVLHRIGFAEEDLAAGGSDRLVDALVAWGDEAAIAERIDQHLHAGADHVALQILADQDDPAATDVTVQQAGYRRLAEAVTSS